MFFVSSVFFVYICPMFDEKFIQILEQAAQVFMRYGIKSVTMDDVARELKISKKTLYKYVSDKGDLVAKVMAGHCQMEQKQCLEILGSSANAIDEMIKITKHVGAMIKEIHPSIHYDLEKYYPEAWKIMSEHKDEFIGKCVENNLLRGIEEGLYRENLNARIISKIYVHKVDMVFDGRTFSSKDFRFENVYFEMVRYHLRGIASKKGLTYLKERIKQEQLNL